jgi:hypothetical protein
MNKSVNSYGLRASLEVLEKKGLGDGALAQALRRAIQQAAPPKEVVVTATIFGETLTSSNSTTTAEPTENS